MGDANPPSTFMSFFPQRVLITGITQACPGVVTCASNHNLSNGQIVRLNIPKAYGMQQLNNVLVQVSIISALTFSIQSSQVPNFNNINTTNYQAFVNAGTGTPAAFISVGSGPTPLMNTPNQILKAEAVDPLDDATSNQDLSEIPF